MNDLPTLSEDAQLSVARDLAYIAISGASKVVGRFGVPVSTQIMEEAVKELNSPAEKVAAYLYEVTRISNHTLESISNYGFSLEVMNAIEALDPVEDESVAMSLIRIRKNIVARRVVVSYLRRGARIVRSKNDLLKVSRAVVALLG